MTDLVPDQLSRLKTALLANGWAVSGATYTHPDAPGLRLNTAYVRQEATVQVDVACPGTRERVVLAYYRGADVLDWCAVWLPKIDDKIFEGLADNPNTGA